LTETGAKVAIAIIVTAFAAAAALTYLYGLDIRNALGID
jgi:hypothetical protein